MLATSLGSSFNFSDFFTSLGELSPESEAEVSSFGILIESEESMGVGGRDRFEPTQI